MQCMGALNILYESDCFRVAEFGAAGIELVDKQSGRSGFLEGPVAARLLADFARLSAADSDEEAVDDCLGDYQALLTQRIRLH
ncbi:MAG: DUF3567 family protein [Burkholderiales bacterium]